MKRVLRILSLVLAVAAVTFWILLGANRGWTRTTVPVKTVDEVTGIEGIEYRQRFAPGIELLGAGLAAAAVLGAISFFLQNHSTKPNQLSA